MKAFNEKEFIPSVLIAVLNQPNTQVKYLGNLGIITIPSLSLTLSTKVEVDEDTMSPFVD